MKLQIIKLVALLAFFAGIFSCTDKENELLSKKPRNEFICLIKYTLL